MVLRVVEVDVVDVVEVVVMAAETVDGDGVVVTLASVPSVTGTIEFGSKSSCLWRDYDSVSDGIAQSSNIHTVCVPHLSGADLPRSRLRERGQQKSDETLAYRQPVTRYRNSNGGISKKLRQDFDHLGYEQYFGKLKWRVQL